MQIMYHISILLYNLTLMEILFNYGNMEVSLIQIIHDISMLYYTV